MGENVDEDGRGERGVTGETGSTGDTADNGDMGYTGDTGDGGDKSDKGDMMGRGVTRMRGEIWSKRKKRPAKERKEIQVRRKT